MTSEWLKTHTFHYSDFSDLNRLVAAKQRKNLKISLCLPTLNEERTIAKEILIMKSELMTRYPLLDEIVVIDSGSTDNTVNIARSYGADVHEANDILPSSTNSGARGRTCGKGCTSPKAISSCIWTPISKTSITVLLTVCWARCCCTTTSGM